MNFDEWYSINPFKELIDSKGLSIKDKKILTPVVVDSSFIHEARKYYIEYANRKKRYIVPDFVRTEYPVYYKKRFLSILCFQHLEKEIKYLIKFVPEAVNLFSFIKVTQKDEALLKAEIKMFDLPYDKAYNEFTKVDCDGRLLGWKVKVERL